MSWADAFFYTGLVTTFVGFFAFCIYRATK